MIFLFPLSGGEEENEIISLRLYSGYSKWEAKQPAKTTAVSTDALSGYLDELSTE